MDEIDKIIENMKTKADTCINDAYWIGRQDERERIAKLLNVQEDEDGNLFIELDDILKEVLGL